MEWVDVPGGVKVPARKCEAPNCDNWVRWAVATERQGDILVCEEHLATVGILLNQR